MPQAPVIYDGHVHLRDTASIAKLIGLADTVGLKRIGIVSCVSRDCINVNPAALACKARHPERVYAFCGLDHSAWVNKKPSATSALGSQVANLIALGADGIKMIEGKPTTRQWLRESVDGSYFREYFARMEATRLPVLWHVNDPEEFWNPATTPSWARERNWGYGPNDVQKEPQYAEVGRVLKRHPGLNIIFAHFYFLSADLPRAARLLDEHPGVNLDLAPGIEYLYNMSRDPEAARAFFVKYAGRIVFGTDIMSEHTPSEAVIRAGIVRRWLETEAEYLMPAGADFLLGKPADGVMRGLALPKDVLGKIYRGNHERIVGKKPRRLVPAKAAAECRRIAALAKNPAEGLAAAEIIEKI